MKLDLEIKEAIRRLLLPIPSGTEEEGITIVKSILSRRNVDESTYPTYIKLKYEAWREEGDVDTSLENIIEEILLKVDHNYGPIFSEKYFRLHNNLTASPLLSFELATILLSHLRLIMTFAKDEDMSAAKIIRTLKSIDNRLSTISWKEVQGILSIIGIKPELEQGKAELLFEEDKRVESEYFADSDIEEACFQIGEIAKSLHFQGNAELLLKKLAIGSNVHKPYLQVLHYQCLVAGFYDHELTRTYEFAPRGAVANWLFSKWDDLVATTNPFLNNLKSVDVLDENWARSKKHGEIEQATALVELLKGLDGLGFAALQEISSWIRRWLVRFIKLNSAKIVPIPDNLGPVQQNKLFAFLKSAPTATFGILEQRLVDLISSVLHRKNDGWRARGLGDPVNANNLSRKKLGDSDFQNSTTKEIVAYEAHGGTLSRIYLDGHIRTLVKSLQSRKEELEGIADISDWKIKIVFAAYDFKENLPEVFHLEGFEVKIEYITFDALLSKIDRSLSPFTEAFKKYFIDIINNRRTPAMVREKITEVLK